MTDVALVREGRTPPPVPLAPVEQRYGWSFWVGLASGWAVMAYAVYGMVQEWEATNPPNLAKVLIGGVLLHDLLIAPLVALLGLLIVRFVPVVARGPVNLALAVSGVVVLFSYPLLRGFGRHAGNPSTLPHDYVANVLLIVSITWIVAAITVSFRVGRKRRQP